MPAPLHARFVLKRIAARREAPQRLVQMIFPEELNSIEPPVLQAESDECTDWTQ